MDNYLGTEVIDPSGTPYEGFTPTEWVMVFIEQYGQIASQSAKAWVLDQVARILKGTPVILSRASWGPNDDAPNGQIEYRFAVADPPSAEYEAWVIAMRSPDPETGEDQYDYDEGRAP